MFMGVDYSTQQAHSPQPTACYITTQCNYGSANGGGVGAGWGVGVGSSIVVPSLDMGRLRCRKLK